MRFRRCSQARNACEVKRDCHESDMEMLALEASLARGVG